MSQNTLHSSEILKKALFTLPQGMPIPLKQLKEWNISRQLIHYYVQSGWLERLGNGFYLRKGDKLVDLGAVAALQLNGIKVHIGGKTALTLKGFTHYLSLSESPLSLYGQKAQKLPAWFLSKFPTTLTNRAIFDEPEELKQKYCLSRLSPEPQNPLISEPERALLELLNAIPKDQTIEEAKQIMEGLQSLRSKKMQLLLEQCKIIKVKRLFWQLAKELQLPVLDRINLPEIDFGAQADYTLHATTNLILRHPNG